jgi:hypothetical protein
VEPISTAHALALLGGKVAVPVLKRFVSKLATAGDQAFNEARKGLFEDWLIESVLLQQQRFDYLRARIDDVEAKIGERAEDPSMLRVHANFMRAADSEPIDERRLMLAFADAALIDPTLTVAELARTERKIRELDPDDVLWLSAIDKVVGRRLGDKLLRHEDEVRWAVLKDSRSADVLASSGCVRVRHESAPGGSLGGPTGWDGVSVTREGDLVLRVLRLYAKTRPLPIVPPGREARPGDVTQAEALAKLDAIAGLRSDVWRMAGDVVARYDSPKAGARDEQPPPPHNAKGVLRIPGVAVAEAEALAARTSTPSPSVNVGMPVDEVLVDARPDESGDAQKRVAQIHGPHDVLRYLADEVDARWT